MGESREKDVGGTPDIRWLLAGAAAGLIVAAFGILRRIRKAYDYVALPERDQLAELQGAVRRLETEVTQLRSEDAE